ncbi:MAG: hypothetical protein WC508_06290 [Patescibacteria group bacterium]
MENKIIKEIKNLRTEIKPRSEWVSLSRDLLLKQIKQESYEPVKIGASSYLQIFVQFFRQSMLEPAVVMLLMMVTFLGSSLGINAAFYSLPGEPLYKVKLALEQTHAAMVSNETEQVNLKIEFAQKRMEELDKIVSATDLPVEQQKAKIKEAVAELQNNVLAVNNHLVKISKSITQSKVNDKDKADTVKMAVAVTSKTEELVKSLDQKLENLPAVDELEVKDLVAGAVKSVKDVNLSAQQLVEDVNQPQENALEIPDGSVKGVDNNDSVSDKSQNTDTIIKIDVKDTETEVINTSTDSIKLD